MWHFQEIVQVFSLGRKWDGPSPFFATPQVKFQPLKVHCTDHVIVGKTVVTWDFQAS